MMPFYLSIFLLLLWLHFLWVDCYKSVLKQHKAHCSLLKWPWKAALIPCINGSEQQQTWNLPSCRFFYKMNKNHNTEIKTDIISLYCENYNYIALNDTWTPYHFSLSLSFSLSFSLSISLSLRRTRTGTWKTVLGWCFSIFLGKLKLLHVQPFCCDPLIQTFVDLNTQTKRERVVIWCVKIFSS